MGRRASNPTERPTPACLPAAPPKCKPLQSMQHTPMGPPSDQPAIHLLRKLAISTNNKSTLPSIAQPPTQRAHVGGPDHAAVLERAAHQVRVVHRLAAAQLVSCTMRDKGGQWREPAQ